MKELFRLMALAIITFGVTAAAAMLGNPEISASIGRRIGLLSDPSAAEVRMTESDTVVRVRRPHPDTWTGLQGFPSQVAVRFPLPHETAVRRGQLHLDLDIQLIERGDGLIRVQVNGTERDAFVLETGHSTRTLTYGLTAADLAAGSLLVSLDGNGTTNQGQICPTNVTNLGAAIEILPTSSLLLELENPLTAAEARVSMLPDPLSLDPTAAPALAAWSAQWLSRQGVDAQLATGAQPDVVTPTQTGATPISLAPSGRLVLAGVEGTTAVGALRGAALPASYGQQWPLPVSALTTDLAVHTFRGSTRWVLNYKLADLPEGRAPSALDLRLRTSRLLDGNHWTVRVVLNGSLVNSTNHAGTGDFLTLDVPMPADLQGLTNQLVVTLVDNTPNQGICRPGPEASAQLLPASRLQPSPSPSGDKQAMAAELAATPDAHLRVPSNADPDMVMTLSRMLDVVLPLDAKVSFDAAGAGATLEPVDAGRIDQLTSGTGTAGTEPGHAYLLLPSMRLQPDGIDVIRLPGRLPPGSAIPPGASGLLMTW